MGQGSGFFNVVLTIFKVSGPIIRHAARGAENGNVSNPYNPRFSESFQSHDCARTEYKCGNVWAEPSAVIRNQHCYCFFFIASLKIMNNFLMDLAFF